VILPRSVSSTVARAAEAAAVSFSGSSGGGSPRRAPTELGHLGRRQIASLVRVAPFACGSGRIRGLRHIRGGRASVRTVLYLATMNAAPFNPVLRALYQRLRRAGKPPKLAFVAIARKLLVILNAIAREKTAWQA
jgi:transposase